MAEGGAVDGSTVWVWQKVGEQGFYYGEPIMASGKDGFSHNSESSLSRSTANLDYSAVIGKKIIAIIGFN